MLASVVLYHSVYLQIITYPLCVCDKQIGMHINEHVFTKRSTNSFESNEGKPETYQDPSCLLYSRTESHSNYCLINQEPLLFTKESQMEASRLKQHVQKSSENIFLMNHSGSTRIILNSTVKSYQGALN
jgi:hypothetical protein